MFPALADKMEQLRDLCRKHRVRRLELFGSAARDGGAEFDPQRSDLDFLVEFEPQERKGFADVYFHLLEDLERLFGREVDLVERVAVEKSRNYIRRQHILSSVEPLYVADDALLLDILLAARDVLDFTTGVDFGRFSADRMMQSAVMRCVQIIGEAADHVSEDFKRRQPAIPWAQMVGMRHRLVHDYTRIDIVEVWSVVEKDIGPLIAMIEPLVPPERSAPAPQ